MHPRLIPLVEDLARQRVALLAAIDGQPADILAQRPAPDSWSPVQILDHIAVVELNIARLLAKRLMRAKEAGLGMDASSEPVRSDRETAYLTQKIDAPENVRPAEEPTLDGALEALRRSQAEMQEMLATADGYDLSQVRARHQIFGELDMYEWLVFTARHEQRHVAQLVRTIAALQTTR